MSTQERVPHLSKCTNKPWKKKFTLCSSKREQNIVNNIYSDLVDCYFITFWFNFGVYFIVIRMYYLNNSLFCMPNSKLRLKRWLLNRGCSTIFLCAVLGQYTLQNIMGICHGCQIWISLFDFRQTNLLLNYNIPCSSCK